MFSVFNNNPLPSFDNSNLSFLEIEFTVFDVTSETFEDYAIAKPKSFINMVAKRRCEYLAGRIASKQVIDLLGFSGQVEQGDQGCPVWPEGLVGSISHIDGRAIACVSLINHLSGLGVDMEFVMNESSAKDLSPHFINATELNEAGLNESQFNESQNIKTERANLGLLSCGLQFNEFATLIFSAKEAIYKALFPSVGQFFGFDAVSLIKLEPEIAIFELQQNLSDVWIKGAKLNVEYVFKQSRVYCLVKIPS